MLRKLVSKKNRHTSLKKSSQILEGTKESVNSLKKTFRQARGKSLGTTTASQQDILRAMLIFSCAGLDALFKQVFKDVLRHLVEKDEGIKDNLQTFIERTLKDEKISIMSGYFLSDNPRVYVISLRERDLCSSSLQSYNQVIEVHQKMNIEFKNQDILKKLDTLFKDRNHIIHEMDMIFGKKNRRQRTQKNIYEQVDIILKIGDNFLDEINKKIIK